MAVTEGKLMTLFREKMAKSKDKGAGKEAVFDVMYSTGFLALDHLNGRNGSEV